MPDELETIREVADATKEVAKTTGKAIDAASAFTGFLRKVIGEPIEIASGTFITDPLKALRYQRGFELQKKVEARLAAQGIDTTRQVAPKVAVPLIENATLEDDDYLHTLWANLLSSAMRPDTAEISKRFVSILAEMSRLDAEVLTFIFERACIGIDYAHDVVKDFDVVSYADIVNQDKDIEITDNEFGDAIRGLIRLGLIKSAFFDKPAKYIGHGQSNGGLMFDDPINSVDIEELKLTQTGIRFFRAVIWTEKS